MRTAAALTVLLVAAGAFAAPPPSGEHVSKGGDAATAKARELFNHAEALYALTRYDEALAEYEKAFEARPLPGFLFNIGQCHRQLNHFERAIYFYRAYLDRQPQTKSRSLVESLIAEMEEKEEARAHAAEMVASTPMDAAPPSPPDAGPSPPIALAPVDAATPPPPRPLLLRAWPEEPRDAPATPAPAVRRWYLWAIAGAVLVGGGLGLGLGLGLPGPPPPHGSLSTIDATQ